MAGGKHTGRSCATPPISSPVPCLGPQWPHYNGGDPPSRGNHPLHAPHLVLAPCACPKMLGTNAPQGKWCPSLPEAISSGFGLTPPKPLPTFQSRVSESGGCARVVRVGVRAMCMRGLYHYTRRGVRGRERAWGLGTLLFRCGAGRSGPGSGDTSIQPPTTTLCASANGWFPAPPPPLPARVSSSGLSHLRPLSSPRPPIPQERLR